MFPLRTKIFPPNAEALRDALEESLRGVVSAQSRIVTVEEKSYPKLRAIRMSLDNAHTIGRPPPPPPSPAGPIEPALHVENFEISGRPIFIGGAALDLVCTARDVQMGQGRDANGNLVLVLQNAAEGRVEIGGAVAELEVLALAGAKAAAGKHGIIVEDLKIELQSRTNRALAVRVHVRARKLFLSATVRLNGEVEVDDRLIARLSGLNCRGEDALGSLVCNFLGPHLERLKHGEFSLLAFPLGEVQLRDIKMAASDKFTVTASFGRAPKALA